MVDVSHTTWKLDPDVVESARSNDEPEKETEKAEPEEGQKDVVSWLVRGIMTAVMEESAVKLAEEMVKFRRFLAFRMLKCSKDKMHARIDLLTLDRTFRAAWKAWIENDVATREDAAYSAFESSLGVYYDEEDNVDR